MALTDWMRAACEVLLPRLCQSCGTRLNDSEDSICTGCIMKLPYRTSVGTDCDDAVDRCAIVTRTVAAFGYTHGSMLGRLINRVKGGGHARLAHQLGVLAAAELDRHGVFGDIDVLLPVPLAPEKLKTRGYNQARELAIGISSYTGLPVVDVMSRPLSTHSQKQMREAERMTNIRGTFILDDPGTCRGKHVMLVDDVMTTGATMHECARQLQGVARAVTLMAVARTELI